ncbi:MAG: class I SAM-dependent methyltransferase [Bdellovibrionaceae bacterium]|nr:class I SAM-dependent methyltransferase [Bdellovibrionales bacterium]MCB9084931.1 class I SAM-dependent methyltransferase [Pseudobdellovibrionaceae bacterium]
MSRVSLLNTSAGQNQDLSSLALELGIPLVDDIKQSPVCLVVVDNAWGLVSRELPDMKPLVIDFSLGEWKRRRFELKGPGDVLSKALGKIKGHRAVDVTAGLGRDSLHLVGLGFEVTAVERSAVLSFLLQAALGRACAAEGDRSDLKSLKIIHADARQYLRELYDRDESPDVVFLDPMFPSKKKSALSGKEAQLLQILFSHTPESDGELLAQALKVVKDRVVVKRPVQAPPVATGARHQYVGKSVRYDVYFPGDKVEFQVEGL